MSFVTRSRASSVLLLAVLSVPFLLSTSKLQSVEADSSFTILGQEYVCNENVNVICLGDAHTVAGTNNDFTGKLSLAHIDQFESESHVWSAGIAYYKEPIRLLDPGTKRSASFNTSFQFFEVPWQGNPGDGMTFVISANNSIVGKGGSTFGFFDGEGYTSFKSVVIEFDSFYTSWYMASDISDNHVSIDINNISAVVARNASDLGIYFDKMETIYAWIEYFANSQMLEVRINHADVRPSSPFISHKVNLFDVVEEHMWVGFTAGNGANFSAYYVGNWTFESHGIPADPPNSHEARQSRKWGTSVGTIAIVVGMSAFLVALLSGLVLVLWYLRRTPMKARRPYFRFPNVAGNIEDDYGEPYRFTLEELSGATKGFADVSKLGEGGFGCVYRGELPVSKAAVAVKKISRESQQGEKEFRAEVSIISQLRHRNLIRLLGWCIDDGKYYIVYDLMSNGSLDKIFTCKSSDEGSMMLSWPQRLKIIQGVATAVDYLHHGWNQQVIHRDIKASNIMLDDKWNAKLGDFGLARLADHQRTPQTMTVAGTIGYMAPEIVSSRTYTEKTDVFAFGTLALEMACGRRSLLLHVKPQEVVLVDWVWQRLSEGNLLSVVDKRLDHYDVKQMETLLLVGLICSHPDPSARPPMRIVVQVLNGDARVPMVPSEKPSLAYKSIDEWSIP